LGCGGSLSDGKKVCGIAKTGDGTKCSVGNKNGTCSSGNCVVTATLSGSRCSQAEKICTGGGYTSMGGGFCKENTKRLAKKWYDPRPRKTVKTTTLTCSIGTDVYVETRGNQCKVPSDCAIKICKQESCDNGYCYYTNKDYPETYTKDGVAYFCMNGEPTENAVVKPNPVAQPSTAGQCRLPDAYPNDCSSMPAKTCYYPKCVGSFGALRPGDSTPLIERYDGVCRYSPVFDGTACTTDDGKAGKCYVNLLGFGSDGYASFSGGCVAS
jgi:hypothetical protein